MKDNYVEKKKFTGLTEGAGGQVELTTAKVDEEQLITAKPEDAEAQKNGGGKRTSKASTTQE